MKIYYDDVDRTRLIGEIKGRVLRKQVDDDKHLVRIYGNTPAFQATIDKYLMLFDAIEVKTNLGYIFRTLTDNWIKHRFKGDYGHGVQYFMNRKNWEVIPPRQNVII